MKRIVFGGFLSASLLMASGCASILNDEIQQVNISSSNGKPISGTIDGQSFQGPGIVGVKRENKNKVIMVATDGCVKETVATKSVDPTFFVNILSGGAFGSTTDYATEKMWRYEENIEISCQ